MQLKNSLTHYGIIAILFHWIMAIIVIGLICLGLYMTTLPTSIAKLKLFRWHKEYGILILMLVSLRIFWRITSIIPSLTALSAFEKYAALIVHWAFYGLMIALPITGWLMTSSAGLPVSFFGLFVLPDLIFPDQDNQHLFATIHEWLAYTLIFLICLHILAALKHHFVNKDDILRRMLS